MTAEIVILNRGAIAMAADSAVTLGSSDRRNKVFNSANKLLMLSDNAPVAVMIFDNAEMLGMPWETIIKTFRRELAGETHPTVSQYADALLEWVAREVEKRTPPSTQAGFEAYLIQSALTEARDRGLQRIDRLLKTRPSVTELAIQRALASEIRSFWSTMDSLPHYDGRDSRSDRRLIRQRTNELDAVRMNVFEHLPLSSESKQVLRRIGAAALTRVGGPAPTTGLVVAGFGDDQLFPEVKSFRVSGVLEGTVRSFIDSETSVVADATTEGVIVPFAQREMVATFVEGIDPSLANYIALLLGSTLDGVPRAFIDSLKGFSKAQVRSLEIELRSSLSSVASAVMQDLGEYRTRQHVDPVLEIVSYMPKEELAELAEALVSLTSLKRRVTMVPETVGGPIDVAVISKGDGFVWIKRKHYFSQELNPRFIANYYRTQNTGGDDA